MQKFFATCEIDATGSSAALFGSRKKNITKKNIKKTTTGVTFAVKVHPRAKRNAITGVVGEAYKLSSTAPALEGRANHACIEFFAELFQVPRSSVTIASGERSRNKVIRVDGVTEQRAMQSLSKGEPA